MIAAQIITDAPKVRKIIFSRVNSMFNSSSLACMYVYQGITALPDWLRFGLRLALNLVFAVKTNMHTLAMLRRSVFTL